MAKEKTYPDKFVRRARPSDSRGVHDSHMRSIHEVCGKDYTADQLQAWGGRPYDEKIRLKTITQDYMWVVDIGGKIEGFGLLIKNQSTPEIAVILGLYLTPEAIGKNFGKKILELMEQFAIQEGIKKLELGSTLTSVGFYKSQGFEATGPRSEMLVGGVGIPYFPMAKNL